ncbi:hypothetical protein JVU11DRAFT_11543 [Chiua virens]|nr:hypothetical protein JVU11DRAFT_11543 [Chiua virens]
MQARETRTQKPQKLEAYMDLFYNEKIWPVIECAKDIPKTDALAAVADNRPKSGRLLSRLGNIMQKSRELFKQESDEVKTMVEQHWKKMVAERETEEEKKAGAMKSTKYYVDKLAPTLGHLLGGLQELTGWSFCVLMGGPTPDTGGKIEACSLHVGTTNLGYTVDQAYPDFASVIMRPFRTFLDQVPAELPVQPPPEGFINSQGEAAMLPSPPIAVVVESVTRRKRQPSKRNEEANSIGDQSGRSQKRAAGASSTRGVSVK